MSKQIKSALISVFDKDGLEPLVRKMYALGITLYSTGGTQTFIENLGIPVIPVEQLTQYPELLGGRVKTLHPGVFGGILWRRDNTSDQQEVKEHSISSIDCVIVDLYPFEKTLESGASNDEIIEKIDIGGIALIRAAAKNYRDVVIIPSKAQYPFLSGILEQSGVTSETERRNLARTAFDVSSHYDTKIFSYFLDDDAGALKVSEQDYEVLRYGENPHQKGFFYGKLDQLFQKLNGKELSYNNLLDADAAVSLIEEFTDGKPTFAILKHNNACGIASRSTVAEAYTSALSCDPISAFGGVLICNTEIDTTTAQLIHSLFCEIIIAPSFSEDALTLLKTKANRIILQRKQAILPEKQIRSALNGFLVQQKDVLSETSENLNQVTKKKASEAETEDLIFANKIAKHTKSNTIVLAKNGQLCSSGTGQTSRVDALRQAIEKARTFSIDLNGAVMASDAFFPFPDCVEIAHKAGITAVIQPGGSIKDKQSIDYCDAHGIAMYATGVRHFRH